MSTLPFKTALLSISLLAMLTSCNKIADVPQQYMRAGNSLALADDGNLIIAGYNSSSINVFNAALIKANASNGDTLWEKTYGGSYSDAFYNVRKSNKGGYIATGFTNRSSTGSPSMFVVITDATGKQLQSLTYGGNDYSQGFCVLPDADSGYLVAGYIQKSGTYDRDIFLVRINDVGAVIWQKRIGAKSADSYASVNEEAYGVVAAPDGGYFLTGSLNAAYNNDGGEIFLMKVSSTGDSLWTKTFGYGFGFSLTSTHNGGIEDGGIAISGCIIEGSNQDVFLLKTDTTSTGILFPAWTAIKTFGGTGYEYGASIIETSDGGFAITGITQESSGLGNQDVFLVRTNSTGESSWEKMYGGTDNDQGYGLVQMPDNGFCITGLSNSGGSFIFLNRTSSDGTQVWEKKIQ
ncbi:MAG: hypothetical protein WC780_06530 [Lentimicrobiaceae bacterium]|jgi:hypothetical protein